MHTIASPTPEWYQFDRQIDYGYRYHESFAPRPPFHQPLPCIPPPAGNLGDHCGCPACLSGGWYAVSPACRFWRADCDICGGTRFYTYRVPRRWWRRSANCFRCQDAWQAAVIWFYLALRDPHAAANLLRHAVAGRV